MRAVTSSGTIAGVLAALARIVGRRPLVVLAGWLVLTVLGFGFALGVVGEGLFPRLVQGEPTVPGEAYDGSQILAEGSDSGPVVGLAVLDVDPADPEVASAMAEAHAELADLDHVVSVAEPITVPGGPANPEVAPLVGVDGDAFMVSVEVANDDWTDESMTAVVDRLTELGAELERSAGAGDSMVGGYQQLFDAITAQIQEDLGHGEVIALPLSLLVMVVVFGGFLAAGMPIVGAIASIAMSLVGLLGFSYLFDLDATAVNVVSVLGLGLCIDYGLLIVSRFREELRRMAPNDVVASQPAGPAGRKHRADDADDRQKRPEQGSPEQRREKPGRHVRPRHPNNGDDLTRDQVLEALTITMRTAGRTVAFSALTVAISLSGLLLFRADLLRAIGAAGISIVMVALAVALTLVPALLALRGRRMLRPGVLLWIPGLRGVLGRFGDVAPDEGFFSRLARRTQRHPFLTGGVVLGLLILLALPTLSMTMRNSGVELLPVSDPQRQYFDTLAEEFPETALPSIQVVGKASPEEMTDLYDAADRMDGVDLTTPPAEVGDGYSVFNVYTDDPASERSRQIARDLSENTADYRTWVTGQTGGLVDFLDAVRSDAVLAVGVVLLATFVLLFLMTGSVLIPLKALIMNVISLGASLGIVVWIFQEGHLSDLLDFTSPGGIETTIPILILAFGFGLAMDYEVFLLSRIKEFYDRGLPNDEAVVAGLQRSGRIITSAALVIVLVFLGFALGELIIIKETGIGLAVAVAIDATLIRCLLVPATMTVLGEWNWWAPGPLRRLHARWQISEA